ncbi:MAG: arginine--tRNA ligase [Verrucomicrobiae bacterium]|nr:arginine--tRNA ligase [Verrucomicrobiae bacterium]
MVSPVEILSREIERHLNAPALVRPCADPRLGDFQANGVLAVAKQRGQNPRALAEQIVTRLSLADVCEPPEVAGPGFINFRLKPSFVAQQLRSMMSDERLGVAPASPAETIVFDFSGPNVAKQMHVGHIRSTIIGDALARVARYLGHRVITDNHLGDWGTQFGMLIVGWNRFRDDAALQRDPLSELERLYREVNARPELREEARAELVKLQRGDPANRAIWQHILDLSRHAFDEIYEKLGVRFDFTLGESFYNPMLPDVVKELLDCGIARVSDGAVCVFAADQPTPLIIQKSDGGYGYGTTDLATVKYRVENWRPHRIVYVTDARQQLHFKLVFATVRRWLPNPPHLEHVAFGSILGEDGKPLRTRSGENIKLRELLAEAEERALTIATSKNPHLPEDQRREIAQVIGIGAVKYADLCQNRTTDYVFSWDKMLALDGNTAPYLQYAYVRIRSIFRKAGLSVVPVPSQLEFQDASELDLGKHLLRFRDVLYDVLADYKPNWLTAYLYELAGKFTAFYDRCPVLASPEPTRQQRLAMCQLTGNVLRTGLDLLGIRVLEQM